jgi:hypothetical protein
VSLGAAGFLVYCVLMTVSRGPLVALGALLAYLFWQRIISLRLAIATIVAFGVAGATVAQLSVLRVVVTAVKLLPLAETSALRLWALDLIPADDPRLMSIPETLGVAGQHPWLGVGMSRLIDLQADSFGKEHNNYLTVLAAFGGLAALCYVLFLASLLWKAHCRTRALPDSAERDLGIALCGGMLGCVIFSNFASADFHFLWIWYGLAAAWTVRTAPAGPRVDQARTAASPRDRELATASAMSRGSRER